MKIAIVAAIVSAFYIPAFADDSNFSTHLFAKFQVRSCTICHDFFENDRSGIAFTSHKGRTPEMCVWCHTQDVTGFAHADEWFAQTGLYTSGMDARQTCEAVKTSLHAKFKNQEMVARQLETHLFEDPRVLWGIEGALPRSGMLPGGAKEQDLVKGGLPEWRKQVRAWIKGGMKCQ